MRLLRQLINYTEVFSGKLEKRKPWVLCGFSVLYLLSMALLAIRKRLWSDELLTLYISKLPSLSDVWSALLTGADQNPVPFFLMTRASLALLGENNFALRLPAVLGFLLMSLCLFKFTAKRSSVFYGVVAMLFPLTTAAYWYAYEARPYGLVLGFGALSLLCWQSATEEHYRGLSLTCLSLSLAATLSSHYYGVFIFFPLALGEAARSLARRRLDLPVWGAFGFGLTPLLLFLPLIRQAKNHSGVFWSPPRWLAVADFYNWLLAPSVLPLTALIVLLAVSSFFYQSAPDDRPRETRALPPLHEIVAVLGFMALPVVAVILAKLVTKGFTDRYALPAIIGLSIFMALAAYRLAERRAIVGAALALLLGGWFGIIEARILLGEAANMEPTEHLNPVAISDFLQVKGGADLPIVISDHHTFFYLAHYAPQKIASRLVYLADPEASLRRLGHSSTEQGALALLGPWLHLNVEEFRPYIAAHPRFLVYGNIGYWNYILYELEAINAHTEFISRDGDRLLFLVDLTKRPVNPSSPTSAEALRLKEQERENLSPPASQ